jgi:hypothetical protein
VCKLFTHILFSCHNYIYNYIIDIYKMVNVHMKLPKVVQSMLQDKNVLYIVAFLAVINFFGYIVLRDSYALLIFLSVGFISTYFSKNMTIVLIVTLILTNFITVISRNLVSGKEGFDASTPESTDAAGAAESGSEADSASAGAKPAAAPAKPAAAPAKPAAAAAAPAKPAAAAAAPAKPAAASSGVMGAGLGGKALKKVTTSASSTQDPLKIEAMTELSPASINDEDDLPVNNRVDYAKTLEKAYDNLENIVGQDGVRGLTSQTNTLMDQQQKLMENMKSMEPLLKTAQSFLDKFESSSMGKLFEKIPGMSSMFGGGAAAAPKAVAQ